MSGARALALTVLAAAALLVPVALDAPPAGAWSNGACPTAAGVTVVVDFQELGGGVWVRCTDGPVQSGFDALQSAGITYQTAVRSGGFLCRIDAKPSDDPCINPSPTTAYWSYWVAPRGGTWCYTNVGAARRPPAGTVEGWSFSLHRDQFSAPAPRVAPPAWVSGAPTSLSTADCTAITATTSTPPPTTGVTPPPPARPGSGVAAVGAGPSGPYPATGTESTPPASDPTTRAPGEPTSADVVAAPADPSASPGTAAEASTTTSVADDDRATSASGRDEVAVDGATSRRPTSGTDPSGSPIGVIAAVVLIAALSATSVLVRRRAAASE